MNNAPARNRHPAALPNSRVWRAGGTKIRLTWVALLMRLDRWVVLELTIGRRPCRDRVRFASAERFVWGIVTATSICVTTASMKQRYLADVFAGVVIAGFAAIAKTRARR